MKVLKKKLKFIYMISNCIIIWNRDISMCFWKRILRFIGKDYILFVKKIGCLSFGCFIWDVKVLYIFLILNYFEKKIG